MTWTLPGTTLQGERADAGRTDGLFRSMMLTGGLTLGQVATITGLEPYTVQNWVKRGFLPAPRGKRYDMEQLCRIITINMLRGALPLEKICGLLSYVNGSLTDESDDIIDDTALYFMFVKLAAQARDLEGAQWEAAISDTLAGYQEPYPGARQRIGQVLRIMLTAWISTRMRQEAEAMLAALD
jgi:DNA-binding transcriptional MerR regulator